MLEMLINPDLQTRESVMAAAGRVQLALTEIGGGVRYIKLEAKVKNPEGSAKRYTAVPLAQATHVFVSEKGYGTQRLGTYYPPKQGYVVGRFYNDVGEDNPHMDALKVAINYINAGELGDARFASIEAESACGLCGHKLEDPVSVERGIGPDCAGKPTGSQILHASAFQPEQQLAIPAESQVAGAIDPDQPTVTLTAKQAMVVLGMFSVTVGETDGTDDEWALANAIQQALGMTLTERCHA